MPCPPPGHLPDPGVEATTLPSPALADRFFTTSATWEAHKMNSSGRPCYDSPDSKPSEEAQCCDSPNMLTLSESRVDRVQVQVETLPLLQMDTRGKRVHHVTALRGSGMFPWQSRGAHDSLLALLNPISQVSSCYSGEGRVR